VPLIKKASTDTADEIWKNDYLDSKRIADYLTPFIDGITQPFVISLNAPYGCGKTYLIKNWAQDLAKRDYKAVYFNAWETDYTDDPLIALAGVMKEQLGQQRKEIEELISNMGAYCIRKIAPAIIKGVVAKIAGQDVVGVVSEIAKFSEKDFEEITQSFAKDALERHTQARESVVSFKKKLSAIVNNKGGQKSEGENKKLVIFIDELDRCRPTYAIEVLECTKHLFDVDGVIFVLAVDKKQLQETVEKIYGTRDGEGYLQKFIDWQYDLPTPDAHQFATKLFYEDFKLKNASNLTDDNSAITGGSNLIYGIAIVAATYHLTLRQISHIFTDIVLDLHTLVERQAPCCLALGIIAALRYVKEFQSERLYWDLANQYGPKDFIKDVRVYMGSAPAPWHGDIKYKIPALRAIYTNNTTLGELVTRRDMLANNPMRSDDEGLKRDFNEVDRIVMYRDEYKVGQVSPAQAVYDRLRRIPVS